MKFTFADGSVQAVKISEATNIEGNLYSFSCKIELVNFSTSVTAQIIYSDGMRGTVLSYSLKTNFDNLLNNDTLDDETVDLVKAIVNYAGYLQSMPENRMKSILTLSLVCRLILN